MTTDGTTAILILGAAILDYLVGDPPQWLHPVQVMGWIINHYCRLIWARNWGKIAEKIAGIVLVIVLIGSTIASVIILIIFTQIWHRNLALILQMILLANFFANIIGNVIERTEGMQILRVLVMNVLAQLGDHRLGHG